MRASKKEHIDTLTRRRNFLRQRVDKRGKMKGGDYDLAEIAALEFALEYLTCINTHHEVRSKIKTIETYENITDLAEQMDLI